MPRTRRPFHGQNIGSLIFDVLNHSFMVLFSIAIVFPFWNIVVLSLSSPRDAMSLGFHLWIPAIDLRSYEYLFYDSRVIFGYVNTVYRTVVGTILTVVMTVFAAYPLSKRNLPWRSGITTYFLVPLFFSGGLVPFFLLIRRLGLVDNRLVYVIPTMLSVYYVIITRSYITGAIDQALEDAALIDGANHMQILFRIIVPLCTPVLATVALWTAVGHWNSWFDSLIFIRTPQKKVLGLILYDLLKTSGAASAEEKVRSDFEALRGTVVIGSSVRAAIIIVSIGPIVLAYPFLQKYFVKGIMIGSLKG